MSAEVEFPISLALRKVGPGAVLAEALFFAEFSRLGANRELAGLAAQRNLLNFIPTLETHEIIRRRRANSARAITFTLELPPPRASEAWRDPLVLTFHAIVWDHVAEETKPAHIVAHVAELGIEVIADPNDNLPALLRRDTLATLRRLEFTAGLKPLAFVQTTLNFAVEQQTLTVRVPSLKDRAIRAEAMEKEGKKTLLQQVATLLGRDREITYEADDTVNDLSQALTANPPQSVLLIGPSGVGKTAAVLEFARRWRAAERSPVFQTSGARIVAGQTGFGMWQERCQELIKDAKKRKAVIHIGPLVELLEVGKSEHNTSGIATFLRPAIARGELLCIAECAPEQIPLVEKQDPQLLDSFRHIQVEEPNDVKGRAILAQFAKDNARRKTTSAALAAIDRLHRRYATYSAYPGRPLRFLENLIRDGEKGEPITETEITNDFTRETGLPRTIIDPAVPLDLADTHAWFAARVVGQPDAVNLITDLLATVKAGLTRPNRPIASLLFIGPTGVGKTEMAKAVAEFLFGSKDRLTRFDMSEFADPISVRRLVGGVFGSEGLLTAKVREQPFSVLLLDEVEKADASFFDLLLQALGEARLTDAGGRLADFRNTVVILTSNLGAESYRRGGAGFVSSEAGKAEAQAHFARAVEQFLRPEMFNRLDRIVPFAPLGTEVIRRIADREWQKVLHRDGVRFRELNLNADRVLLDHLASIGFDPRYGARPLKRAMERELLAPLAHQMNRHTGDTPLAVEIGIANSSPSISVKPLQGVRAKSSREPNSASGKLALNTQTLRRWHQLLADSSTVRELNNDVYQLQEQEKKVLKKQAAKKKLSEEDVNVLTQLGRLREVAEAVAFQRATAFALEDAAVVAFHESTEPPSAELQTRLDDANREWDKLLIRLYALNAPAGDSVTLALFSEHRGHLADLTAAYCVAASASGLSVKMVRYDLLGDNESFVEPPKPPELPRAANLKGIFTHGEPEPPQPIWKEDRLWVFHDKPAKAAFKRVAVLPTQPHTYTEARTLGIAIQISGTGANLRFGGERGLHEIKSPDPDKGDNPNVTVRVNSDSLADYQPSLKITRRGWYRDDDVRRQYDFNKSEMRDDAVEQAWSNMSGSLTEWLRLALAANVRARLLKMIVE